MEGFQVLTIEDTLGTAISMSLLQEIKTITLEQVREAMKDQVIVCNIGHFDNEIQVDALRSTNRRRKGQHQTTS